MFETDEFTTVLLDTFFKGALLFLITLIIIRTMRAFVWKGSNVHNEHRIWLFLALAMLALPIIEIASPRLRIP
ncbi:MAG: hypothetical protein AAGA30_19265, partial [Planctomycetota bacterium]